MPTAQEIIASDAEINLVFEVTLDNNAYNAPTDYNWVGGDSMLAHALNGGEVLDNSYNALSSGVVDGLATNEVIVGGFYLEKSLGKPFEGGADWSAGTIEIEFEADGHGFHLRDWENKPFTISVGYKSDAWGSYQTLATGKTIGSTLTGRKLTVSLSVTPVGTDKLYPTEVYTTGDSKGRPPPYIFGTVNKVRPVKVSARLFQFHNGTVNTTDSVLDNLPASEVLSLGGGEFEVFGNISFEVVAGATSADWVYSSADNAIPSDVTSAYGSVTTQDECIQILVPDRINSSGAGDHAYCWAFYNFYSGTPAEYKDFITTVEVGLDSSSTVESFDIYLAYPYDTPFTITKSVRTITLGYGESVTPQVFCKKLDDNSQDADTVKVNVYKMSQIPRPELSADVQAFVLDRGEYKKLSTFRVEPSLQAYTDQFINTEHYPRSCAAYDSDGFLYLNDDLTDVYIDAVGEDADIKSIAACQAISTAANGSDSPVTASFTGEEIGYYANEQKPMITHIRDILRPLDCFIDPDLATNNIVAKRRFNNQPEDFDGVTNDVATFDFQEHHIVADSVVMFAAEPSDSKYTVLYNRDHNDKDQSLTVADTAARGHLNQRKEIITPLRAAAPALEIAGLVTRDGARKARYGLSVYGVGHGLELSGVGKVTHPHMHQGKFELRKIRENIMQKVTYIEGVVYV